jgi:hypothetical protein
MSSADTSYLDDLIQTLSTIRDLGRKEDFHDDAFYKGIKNAAKTASQLIIKATGMALHRLDETKPRIEAVQKLVRAVPDALSYEDSEFMIPIQWAVHDVDSIKYIPIMAQEGAKSHVGGEDKRGGLLLEDLEGESVCETNVLQLLFVLKDESDATCLKIIKELRKMNLLLKSDIQEYNLLYCCCKPSASNIFQYMVQWDPDALRTHETYGLPLFHAVLSKGVTSPGSFFEVFLKASIKHHPQHLGLLFQKDSDDLTACEYAFSNIGKEQTFKAMQSIIPAETDLPILHHVNRHAPQYINDFARWYPSAIFQRDENGRTIKQDEITRGAKTFDSDAFFFINMTDDEIAAVDPMTGQYPFLTMATTACDVQSIFYLLRRNPSLIESYRVRVTRRLAEAEIERKRRKREEGPATVAKRESSISCRMRKRERDG